MKLAPSILSADFANLERDIRLVEELEQIIFMLMSWTVNLCPTLP